MYHLFDIVLSNKSIPVEVQFVKGLSGPLELLILAVLGSFVALKNIPILMPSLYCINNLMVNPIKSPINFSTLYLNCSKLDLPYLGCLQCWCFTNGSLTINKARHWNSCLKIFGSGNSQRKCSTQIQNSILTKDMSKIQKHAEVSCSAVIEIPSYIFKCNVSLIMSDFLLFLS